MEQTRRVILVLASRLMGYPTNDFQQIAIELDELIENTIKEKSLRVELQSTYTPLRQLSNREVQELYVETFDLKSKLGLYLTAHELGDSNKRGAALIKLQKVISQSGFERVGEELVDYMPMIL